MARTSAVKHTFTVEDVYARARGTLEQCLLNGVGHMRTHVEVDPNVGMRGYEAIETKLGACGAEIERIQDASVTPRYFEAPDAETADATAAALRQAWDIIADQPATDVLLRFPAAVASRVQIGRAHV